MEAGQTYVLIALIFSAALLYSSVGHAGASGYLAAMALFGLAPASMKPAALALNILVATIATVKYYRAGCFSWSLFWPFAAVSIPFAYLGGLISLPGAVYKPLLGAVLLYAAWRSLREAGKPAAMEIKPPPRMVAAATGGGLGLLSGLTGVGGGIFLSPLLLLLGWAETRQVSGTSAAFILVNSIAGLIGVASSGLRTPETLPLWLVAAMLGGFVGSEFGSRRLSSPAIKRLLAVVLAIAGCKMILTA